jgi:hypothetical protein
MGSCGFAFAPPPLLPRPYLPVVRRAQSHKNVGLLPGRERPPQHWNEGNPAGFLGFLRSGHRGAAC